MQQLLGSAYLAATEKSDLKTLGDPLIQAKPKDAENERLVDLQEALDLLEMPESGDFTFVCEIEVRPEFELPSLEGIPLKKQKTEITDADVDGQFERMHGMLGGYETVEDGQVEEDDRIRADLKMACEGEVLKEQTDVQVAARPQMIDGIELQELGKTLAGAKVGETRTISGTVPDSYAKPECRGKQAQLELAIREISRLKLPPREQVWTMFGHETEAELREWLREHLDSRIQEAQQRALRDQLSRYLLDHTSFELPDRLTEQQVARTTTQTMLNLYRQGVPPSEVEKRIDELRTSAREEALRSMKLVFIMEKLADEIEVTVTEGEMNGQISLIAQQQGRRFDRVRDDLAREGALAGMYAQLRDEKILDALIEKADITEEEAPAEGKAEKPAEQEKKDDQPADDTAEET